MTRTTDTSSATPTTRPTLSRIGRDVSVGLLVSVRCPAEATAALAGGADVIDVKEPRRGPLGRADPDVVAAVIESVAGRAPITAALGELTESPNVAYLPDGLEVVKIGLAGAAATRWEDRVERLRNAASDRVDFAVAAYADHQACESPPVDHVIGRAVGLGVRWLVIDTWSKTNKSSLELLGRERASRLLASARANGLAVVLAGGLSETDLPEAGALRPDHVGVRGAACDGGRSGTVCTQRVRRLCDQLSACRIKG